MDINVRSLEQANRNNSINKWAKFLFAFYIITIYLFVNHPQYIIISEISFIAFLGLSMLDIVYRRRVYLGIYLWLPFLFICYSLITYFWAMNGGAVFSKTKTLIQLLFMLFLIFNTFCQQENINFILRALLIAGICLSIYALFHYGVDIILNAMSSNLRLGGDISQENTFGMQLSTTVVLCIYFFLFYGEKIMLPIAVFPFFLAMSSGSRKSLIILIIGMVLLLYFKTGMKNLYKFIIGVAVFILIFSFIIKMPVFYTTFRRMEGLINLFTGRGSVDHSASYRQLLIKQGIDWFKDNPIFGYGLANYRFVNSFFTSIQMYAHNNFVELLVGVGLIGFMIYYSIYIYIFAQLLPLIIRKNSEVIVVFILLIIRFISDYGSVSYDSKITWIYFALGFLTVAKYKRKERNVPLPAGA